MNENSQLADTIFMDQFFFNQEQLLYRIKRAWNIDRTAKESQSEYLMVFDSALCLFRAMFLEKLSKNYTYQNYFQKIGKPEIAENINKYLDEPFDW